MINIRKAERRKAKLRLGLAGPSGAGKTMSALKLAAGLGGRICLIDTERGSGDLYAHLFNYDIITIEPPFKPSAYVEAIKAAEAAGYDVIIVDSLSHAWSDEGGLLDQADKLSAGGNRFTVWADLTPQHRLLVNALIGSPKHIVATVRSKTAYELQEYTDQKGNKKSRPVKMGMAPVQREGMEYEFTVFMDIEINHQAHASKDRTDLFKDEVFQIDETTGKRLIAWLNSGVTDVNAEKRDLVAHLTRLGFGMPSEAADRGSYIIDAITKLTGITLTPETMVDGATLEAVNEALKAHTDPAKAQTLFKGIVDAPAPVSAPVVTPPAPIVPPAPTTVAAAPAPVAPAAAPVQPNLT